MGGWEISHWLRVASMRLFLFFLKVNEWKEKLSMSLEHTVNNENLDATRR